MYKINKGAVNLNKIWAVIHRDAVGNYVTSNFMAVDEEDALIEFNKYAKSTKHPYIVDPLKDTKNIHALKISNVR